MATVRVLRAGARFNLRSSHPSVELRSEKGGVVVFPFAPALESDGYARQWVETSRPGRKPLLESPGKSLKRFTFTAIFADKLDFRVPIDQALEDLRRFAEKGRRVRWRNYSRFERGWYRIAELTVRDERRALLTNRLTRAEVSMTLVEAREADLKVGPVSGGKGKKK